MKNVGALLMLGVFGNRWHGSGRIRLAILFVL